MKTKPMRVYWGDLSPVTIDVEAQRYVAEVMSQAVKMMRLIHGDAFAGAHRYSLIRKSDSMILSPVVQIGEFLRPAEDELELTDYYNTADGEGKV